MKQAIKRYRAFTSGKYRIFLLLVTPVVLLVFNYGLMPVIKEISLFLTTGILLVAEAFADYWFLGGICSKNCVKLEYLKTSFYGVPFMRSIIWMDMGLRLLENIVVIGGCAAYGFFAGQIPVTPRSILFLLVAVLICFSISTMSSNLLRHFEMFQLEFSVSSLFTAWTVVLMVLVWYTAVVQVMICLLAGCVFVAAAVSYFTGWYMLHHVKKTFYDWE